MDNCNIQLFKDGDDIIVVFKNPAKDIKDIVTQLLFAVSENDVNIKHVPAVLPLPNDETCEPDIDKYERIVPEFLSENYGPELNEVADNFVNEQTNEFDDAKTNGEDAVIDEISSKKENDIPDNIFVSGKYKNMRPIDVVEKYGHIGFYVLCSTYKKGVFRTPELKQDIYNTIKEYLALHDRALGDIRQVKSEGLKELLTACYEVCKDTIEKEIHTSNKSNFETYLNEAEEFPMRGLCWKCINEIRKYVKAV